MRLNCDLHNHSCLSPCASLDSSPSAIAKAACLKGLDVLGLTDHGCAENAPAFEKACLREGIIPVFGIEINTREELHLLCYFDDLSAALEMGRYFYSLLPPMPPDPQYYTDQAKVDENDFVLDLLDKTLTNSIDLSLDEIFIKVEQAGGYPVPAHIDREHWSLISQLGFVPEMDFPALELRKAVSEARYSRYPIFTSSDAHYPDDIGSRYTTVDLDRNNFSLSALFKALQKGKRSLHF